MSTVLTPELPVQIAQAAPRITVVGDVMLDVWLHGRSERLAREAPAPVVDLAEEIEAGGGAANTALNLAALGARVTLVGAIGDDPAGARLRALLEEAGVDTTGLVVDPQLATTTKSRIVVADQVMVRLDRGAGAPTEATMRAMAHGASAGARSADALVVCDYGTTLHHCRVAEALAGALGPGPADGRVRSVADAAPERPLLVVDAHDPTAWAALRPDVVTPNAAEAEAVLGTRLGTGAARLRALEVHAEALLTRTSATHVVVTLDRDGTVLLGPEGIRHRTWADPATEKQASGAGDTFVAALTLALSTGVPLTAAADLGQAAADVVVHRLGTSLCRAEDLRAHLSGSGSVVRTLPALQADLAQARAAGRRIVLTNGCFDGLRHGHTQYLSQAAHLGDVLVVGVNDDASTARLRGPGRPRVPLEERAGLLAALACVDHVVPFTEDTAENLIRALRPDVYVKGGDYTADMVPERAAAWEYGGQVRILDLFADDAEELPGAAAAGTGGSYVGP